jgi:hypothetical protein
MLMSLIFALFKLMERSKDDPSVMFSFAFYADIHNSEGVALGAYATLIGALQLARAVEGQELLNRMLPAGKDAAQTLIKPRQDGVA